MERIYPVAKLFVLLEFLFLSFFVLPIQCGASEDFIQYDNFQELLDAHQREVFEKNMQMIPNTNTTDYFIIIAIDGCAGSGKTSTARRVASSRKFALVCTGDHYRVLTHHFRSKGIAAEDNDAIDQILQNLRPETVFEGNVAHLTLNGEILSTKTLHNEEINSVVSDYAQNLHLRAFLHCYQRQLPDLLKKNGFHGLVIEGRDVTSVVFPRADLRLFLQATPELRQHRRDLEGIVDNICGRDVKDMNQLQLKKGVITIDSSDLSLEEVTAIIGKKIDELPVFLWR